MRGILLVAAVALVTGCGGGTVPTASVAEIAASEAVQLLKTSDSPYGVIYHPPVDLAKR